MSGFPFSPCGIDTFMEDVYWAGVASLEARNRGVRAPAAASPYALLQEQVTKDAHYPWRVIVSCALLNRTTGEQAHKAAGELFYLWPDPKTFLFWNDKSQFVNAERAALRSILRPLGLVNRRAEILLDLTEDYLAGISPYDCRGVGPYGRDALDVFCAGELLRDPADHYLRQYTEWRRRERAERIEWDEAGYFEWCASLAAPRVGGAEEAPHGAQPAGAPSPR